MLMEGKAAVVTGGAAGIGRATCIALARAGADVIVVDREAAGEETADLVRGAGTRSVFVPADVTRADEVLRYVDAARRELGGIDCFFNNAGIEGRVAPTVDYDDDVFDAVIAVNVRGVYLGLKHVMAAMLEKRGGAIVNTSSVAGVSGSPGLCGYVASKHAVIGMTRVAALEYGGRGIRVNAVCPGPTQTRMIQSLEQQAGAGSNDPSARFKSAIPIGRYAEADEIADLVVFLLSDHARSINGAHYVIDGGRTAGLSPAQSAVADTVRPSDAS